MEKSFLLPVLHSILNKAREDVKPEEEQTKNQTRHPSLKTRKSKHSSVINYRYEAYLCEWQTNQLLKG
jgi:hypothetical protein